MGNPAKIKVVICSSGTYSPGDKCTRETDGMELRGEKSQQYYLNLEHGRVKALGLIPEKVLGDEPPWSK